MSDTWTPGPWRFDGWNAMRRQAKILMDCNHPEGWHFGGWMGTRTEANARLIAAAPDMAEALEACIFALGQLGANTLGGSGRKEWEQARAALAKARGQA